MFAGQEKSSIDKDAGVVSLNCGIFSAQSPKRSTNLYYFTNWFYLKVFNGHEKKQFSQPCWNIFAEVEIFLGQNAEKLERNCEFFSESIFPRSVSLTSNKAFLTTLLKRFCRKTKFHRLTAEIDRKIVSFSTETIFWEKLSSTKKEQFWSSFRYNFCCIPVFSAKSAKIEQKCTHFTKRIFNWKLAGQKKGCFENLA